jgi:hypothetical protein
VATQDELDDARVTAALGRLLASGAPFDQLPFLSSATHLFPDAVMDALDGRYPDAASVASLETLVDSGRLSEPELSTTIVGIVESSSPGLSSATLPLATEGDVYGESTAAGAGFETNLAAYTGMAFTNRGVAGQGVADELMRSGAIRPLLTLSGNAIPAGTTAVSVTAINPDRGWRVSGSGSFAFTGTLNGIEGQLSHDLTTNTWTFTRSVAGSVVAVPAGTPFIRKASLTTPTRRQIFWGGRNNVTDGTMPTLAEMVALVGDGQSTRVKELLVLGVINGTSEGDGTANYDRIVAYNTRLSQIFGDLFYDLRVDFIARGLDIRGIEATPTDTANIAADKPPASLMADSIHPNADGYLAINYLVAEKLLALGWVDSIDLPDIPVAVEWDVYTSDSFNRADGAPGTSDAAAGGTAQAWTADSQLGIVSNRLAATATLTANRFVRVAPGLEAAVEFDWTEGTGLQIELGRVDTNNRYTFAVATGGGNGIYKRVSGTNSPVNTGTESCAAGDHIRFEAYYLADETTLRLRVKRNGTTIAQYDDASPLVGTNVGIGSQFSGSPWSVDNAVIEVRAA